MGSFIFYMRSIKQVKLCLSTNFSVFSLNSWGNRLGGLNVFLFTLCTHYTKGNKNDVLPWVPWAEQHKVCWGRSHIKHQIFNSCPCSAVFVSSYISTLIFFINPKIHNLHCIINAVKSKFRETGIQDQFPSQTHDSVHVPEFGKISDLGLFLHAYMQSS